MSTFTEYRKKFQEYESIINGLVNDLNEVSIPAKYDFEFAVMYGPKCTWAPDGTPAPYPRHAVCTCDWDWPRRIAAARSIIVGLTEDKKKGR